MDTLGKIVIVGIVLAVLWITITSDGSPLLLLIIVAAFALIVCYCYIQERRGMVWDNGRSKYRKPGE